MHLGEFGRVLSHVAPSCGAQLSDAGPVVVLIVYLSVSRPDVWCPELGSGHD